MRVLLDEDLPRRLGRELVGHEVSTVQGMGWAIRPLIPEILALLDATPKMGTVSVVGGQE